MGWFPLNLGGYRRWIETDCRAKGGLDFAFRKINLNLFFFCRTLTMLSYELSLTGGA